MQTKNGIVAVIGRPNVGKSTRTNALVGEKVAIVSDKPQTTRTKITGVVNRNGVQTVLLDTPGFHKAKTRLGTHMDRIVTQSVADVDAVALVVEPAPKVGVQEQMLIQQIKAAGVPAVLVINKIDTVEKPELLPVITAYAEAHDFAAVIPVSARKKDGLEMLLTELEKYAQDGPLLYPEDEFTDQTMRQMAAETIREKLLRCLDKEIPHGTAVEITKYSTRADGVTEIDAVIYCEKASHKGMIIGKEGSMLRKIGAQARHDLERALDGKVFLQTWVRVKENWRDSDILIKNFGLSTDE